MTQYSSVEKIARIRLLCHHVLPAVYDESLSYMEALAKLTFKVNETIEATNTLNDNVGLLRDVVTELNERVTAVEGEIDGFEAEIERRFAELETAINASVDAKLAEVDAKIEDVENRVSILELTVDATLKEFREYMEAELKRVTDELTSIVNLALSELDARFDAFSEEMRQFIQDEIDEALKKIPEITSVMVIDPTTGKLTPIQECLDNMLIYSSYNALTVDEWNRLGLTVDEVNHIIVKSLPIGMNVYQTLHDAKNILLPQLSAEKAEIFAYPHSIVREYLSGDKVWHDRNVDINWLMWATTGTYACVDLVDMQFTFDELVAANLTVDDWNMKGNIMLVHTEP